MTISGLSSLSRSSTAPTAAARTRLISSTAHSASRRWAAWPCRYKRDQRERRHADQTQRPGRRSAGRRADPAGVHHRPGPRDAGAVGHQQQARVEQLAQPGRRGPATVGHVTERGRRQHRLGGLPPEQRFRDGQHRVPQVQRGGPGQRGQVRPQRAGQLLGDRPRVAGAHPVRTAPARRRAAGRRPGPAGRRRSPCAVPQVPVEVERPGVLPLAQLHQLGAFPLGGRARAGRPAGRGHGPFDVAGQLVQPVLGGAQHVAHGQRVPVGQRALDRGDQPGQAGELVELGGQLTAHRRPPAAPARRTPRSPGRAANRGACRASSVRTSAMTRSWSGYLSIFVTATHDPLDRAAGVDEEGQLGGAAAAGRRRSRRPAARLDGRPAARAGRARRPARRRPGCPPAPRRAAGPAATRSRTPTGSGCSSGRGAPTATQRPISAAGTVPGGAVGEP